MTTVVCVVHVWEGVLDIVSGLDMSHPLGVSVCLCGCGLGMCMPLYMSVSGPVCLDADTPVAHAVQLSSHSDAVHASV